ncbi:MAG: hypothetical protein MAG551_01456 [Candidatus Scalindua arabica]|uniref:DUF433 domain-containing protein n=1 Tax=Candidatus Scalindua arabica TaxID=1127984 RepID=A0A941W3C3_9BACT|nr:hypothetical protein [Candidatus Scalindua arabica]
MDVLDRITANREILGGKPVIKGTRISVEFVLELLASGVAEDQILQDYSHLTKDDIHACLQYAAKALKNEIFLELEST